MTFFPKDNKEKVEVVEETVTTQTDATETKNENLSPDPNEGKILLSPEELNEKVKQMVAEQLGTLQPTPQPQVQPKVEYQEFKKIENKDDIPELEGFIPKNRRYEIINGTKTVSHGIRTRSKKASPLLYIHPVTGESHPLRLTENHPSFFEHLQFKEPGSNRLRFVKFIDGVLYVPSTDLQLQKFLHIHPDKGLVFREIDAEQDAKKELDAYELKFKAQELVRGLDFPSQDSLARFICKSYSSSFTPSEIKRLLFVEVDKASDHKHIISLCENKSLLIQGLAKLAVENELIKFEDYRFIDNKGVLILDVGRNRNEWDAIGEYLTSNQGDSLRSHLEKTLY